MAQSFYCKCPERKKPVDQRNWVVRVYRWNFSKFVKAGGEYSDYSTVQCKSCGAVGRTKAKYVNQLKHEKYHWEQS